MNWLDTISDSVAQDVEHRLSDVRRRIETASQQAGRVPSSITLVAVTKYCSDEQLRAAYRLGLRDFGESRPQQLAKRAASAPADIRWHMIGHLQRNKVELVTPAAAYIHSVDSLRLAERISQVAHTGDHCQKVLLEVNVSGEASKHGVSSTEVSAVVLQMQDLPNIDLCGLMTMAPHDSSPTTLRSVFRTLNQLARDVNEMNPNRSPLMTFSMGMSGDFEEAIAEGATMIRLGSTLFGT